MTTYVLGAGASAHAGYPVTAQLWPRLVTWVTSSPSAGWESQQAIQQILALNGPVTNLESVLTDLVRGQEAFSALENEKRDQVKRGVREGIADYFRSIREANTEAHLYTSFTKLVKPGDGIISFNYDVALEQQLIRAKKFRVRDGYGFPVNWDEPETSVKVLKLHGSVNWIALLFGGGKGPGTFRNSLGDSPRVDNAQSDLPEYQSRVLDKSFPGGGVAQYITLVLPAHEKRFGVSTSVREEWVEFYRSLWSQAADSLQRSDRIVLIGYSMPSADEKARSLLLGHANKRAEVSVSCGSSNSSLAEEFHAHGFPCVTDSGRFEDYLNKHISATHAPA